MDGQPYRCAKSREAHRRWRPPRLAAHRRTPGQRRPTSPARRPPPTCSARSTACATAAARGYHRGHPRGRPQWRATRTTRAAGAGPAASPHGRRRAACGKAARRCVWRVADRAHGSVSAGRASCGQRAQPHPRMACSTCLARIRKNGQPDGQHALLRLVHRAPPARLATHPERIRWTIDVDGTRIPDRAPLCGCYGLWYNASGFPTDLLIRGSSWNCVWPMC
jgi:hypothetical protein